MSTKTTQQADVLDKIYLQLKSVSGYFTDYPLISFLLLLVATFFLAKIISHILTGFIAQFTRRTRFRWDDQINQLLHRPVYWSLFLPGIQLAVIPLKLSTNINAAIHSLVVTILVLVWSMFLIRIIVIILREVSRNSEGQSLIRPQTRPLFQNLAYILVFIIAVYLIFSSWHIDMTAWLASAGIAGIAIGFAAKDTLANLFAGVFILADSPYKIGDYVVLDSGERGQVTHIGIRSTRLLTRGDVEITIPNAVMGNSKISNESGGPYTKYRLNVKIGVAYGSDIDQVRELLLDIAQKEPGVCDEPYPRVRFRAFADSALALELLCWVENPEFRGRVLDALNTEIYKRFNSEGIEIPYNKQDVYIKQMPSSD